MKNHRGFTLIEALVTTLLISILAVTGIYVVATTNNVLKKNYDEVIARENINRLMATINKDIKEAIYISGINTGAETSPGFYTRQHDGSVVNWYFSRGFIFRNKQEFVITGADDYFAEADIIVYPNGELNNSKYPSVKTNIKLKLIDESGVEFQVDSLSNTFYSRMNPEGFDYYGLN